MNNKKNILIKTLLFSVHFASGLTDPPKPFVCQFLKGGITVYTVDVSSHETSLHITDKYVLLVKTFQSEGIKPCKGQINMLVFMILYYCKSRGMK